jgi:hypothetical protein
MMHRNINIKFIDAKQAREIYQYKNIKDKLYRTNATIWYNKICWQKQLTPTYINICINGKTNNATELSDQLPNTALTLCRSYLNPYCLGGKTAFFSVGI